MFHRVCLLPLALLAGCHAPANNARTEGDSQTTQVVRASFNPDGSVNRPIGYRHWYHASTRLKPDGNSILDGLPIRTPEFLNTYIEPSALAAYRKTGEWPDGAQLVKEFSVIKTGENCDKTTYICTTSFGRGLFEAGYIGLGMMVKDAKRFPAAAGNWGYFEFGHKPPPYDKTNMVRPTSQCQDCHIAVARDTDFVVSASAIGTADRSDEH